MHWLKFTRAITANTAVRNVRSARSPTPMADAVPLPDALEIPDAGFPKLPTYGTLLKLKQLADGVEYWLQHPDIPCSGPQMLLSKWVTSLFPAITVQRPGRFYQTVERLELPTTGRNSLNGLELEHYLQRTWTQKNTRNTKLMTKV